MKTTTTLFILLITLGLAPIAHSNTPKNTCWKYPSIPELELEYNHYFLSKNNSDKYQYLSPKQYSKFIKEATATAGYPDISFLINLLDTVFGILLTAEKLENFNSQIELNQPSNIYHNTTNSQRLNFQQEIQALLLEKAETNKNNETTFQDIYGLKAFVVLLEAIIKIPYINIQHLSLIIPIKYIYLSLYSIMYGYSNNSIHRIDKYFRLRDVRDYVMNLKFKDSDQEKLFKSIQENLQLINSLSSPIYSGLYFLTSTFSLYHLSVGGKNKFQLSLLGSIAGLYPYLPSLPTFGNSKTNLLDSDKRFRQFCLLKRLQYEWGNNDLTTYNLLIKAGANPFFIETMASMLDEDPVILTHMLGNLLPFLTNTL